MDTSRKANREDDEITLQYKSRQEALLDEELVEEKLAELHASIEQLKQTPVEAAELQRRIKLFGECKRNEGETSGEFYGRLRHWLDRDVQQTKSPLHAPRQTGEEVSADCGRKESTPFKSVHRSGDGMVHSW